MRLTLRTMLAYMDDILDPESTQLIRKKIEESEFATGLLHRARDSMRRLRLGTPKVLGHGVGLDPNTVAEYLDNTLSDDRVPDFEKVCLESDVHLAEVASCHQILAMVLGEPAEVDTVARQRMYQLPHLPMPSGQSGDGRHAASPAEAVEADAAAKVRLKPSIPDYLREPERKGRLKPVLVWLTVAGVVAVAVLIALGPFSRNGRLARLLGLGEQPQEAAPDSATDRGPQPDDRQEVAGVQPTEPEAESPKSPTSPPSVEAEAPEEPKPGQSPGEPEAPTPPVAQQPIERPPTEPPAPKPEGSPTPPVAPGPGPPAPGPVAKPSEPTPVPAPTEPEPAAPGEGVEVAKVPSTPMVKGVLPEPGPVGPIGPLPEGTVPAEKTAPAEPAPVPPEAVGQLISDEEVLVRHDPGTEHWFRVPAHKPLQTQQRLLALPTYEPQIVLTAGPSIQLIGASEIEFAAKDADGVPGVKLVHGRVILRSMGHPQAILRIQVGDRRGTITLLDPEATLALQATPLRAPGKNPETEAGYLSVDYWATAGQVRWEEAGSAAVLLKAPAWLTLSDQQQGPMTVGEFPEWISEALGLRERTKVDFHSVLDRQRTSGTLEKEIDKDKRIGFSLNEVVARHPQKEVKRLALWCLTATGEFDDVVAALDNPDQKLFWSDLTPLQSVLARGPGAAADLREAFTERYGQQDGTELYDMLWRYTADNLTRADAERLIGYLDRDTLAFRVLAFWNLQRITGQGHFYRPDQPEQDRRKRVAMWQRALEDGRIQTIEPKSPKPAPE